MARTVATTKTVDRGQLLDFVSSRHQWVVATMRTDGRPQTSPVTGGVGADGKLIVSTYPERAKVHNIRQNPAVTVCVLSDHFGGAWVQVDGQATIVDLPEAMDGLVEYFRSVSGEHPDWHEYRAAMERQGKCLIVIEPERWGPVATGGFPAPVVRLLDELDGERAEAAESADTQADDLGHQPHVDPLTGAVSGPVEADRPDDDGPMEIAGFAD